VDRLRKTREVRCQIGTPGIYVPERLHGRSAGGRELDGGLGREGQDWHPPASGSSTSAASASSMRTTISIWAE
jgi:hypothetical protein